MRLSTGKWKVQKCPDASSHPMRGQEGLSPGDVSPAFIKTDLHKDLNFIDPTAMMTPIDR